MQDRFSRVGDWLAAGAVGSALTYLVGSGSQPRHADWPYGVLGGVALVGVAIGGIKPVGAFVSRVRMARADADLRSAGVGSLWRQTSSQFDATALGRLSDASMPGVNLSWHDTYVRFGASVGCVPASPDTSASRLAEGLLQFLNSPVVSELIGSFVVPASAAVWQRQAGDGLHLLEAVLKTDEDVVLASASLSPAIDGARDHGMPQDIARLYLHIGLPAPAEERVIRRLPLDELRARLLSLFALPSTLAGCLSERGLTVMGLPPASVGVVLHSPHGLGEILDLDSVTVLPGRGVSNEFLSWAVTEPDGEPATTATSKMLRQIFEHSLHLDNVDMLLAALESVRPDR